MGCGASQSDMAEVRRNQESLLFKQSVLLEEVLEMRKMLHGAAGDASPRSVGPNAGGNPGSYVTSTGSSGGGPSGTTSPTSPNVVVNARRSQPNSTSPLTTRTSAATAAAGAAAPLNSPPSGSFQHNRRAVHRAQARRLVQATSAANLQGKDLNNAATGNSGSNGNGSGSNPASTATTTTTTLGRLPPLAHAGANQRDDSSSSSSAPSDGYSPRKAQKIMMLGRSVSFSNDTEFTPYTEEQSTIKDPIRPSFVDTDDEGGRRIQRKKTGLPACPAHVIRASVMPGADHLGLPRNNSDVSSQLTRSDSYRSVTSGISGRTSPDSVIMAGDPIKDFAAFQA
eukprot:gene14574-22291_t